MTIRNSSTGYGVLARGLHWSMALLLVGLIGLGVYMTGQPDGDPKWALYDLHKSLGVMAFALLLVRLIWRYWSPPPGLPASMSVFDQRAAHAGHFLLYAAMLMLPVTGYLDSAFGGYHISVFGLFEIPMLFEKNPALNGTTLTKSR